MSALFIHFFVCGLCGVFHSNAGLTRAARPTWQICLSHRWDGGVMSCDVLLFTEWSLGLYVPNLYI
jgi:hypothetical protein